MLLGARHVPERLCGGLVYLGRYNKCSPLPFLPLFVCLCHCQCDAGCLLLLFVCLSVCVIASLCVSVSLSM